MRQPAKRKFISLSRNSYFLFIVSQYTYDNSAVHILSRANQTHAFMHSQVDPSYIIIYTMCQAGLNAGECSLKHSAFCSFVFAKGNFLVGAKLVLFSPLVPSVKRNASAGKQGAIKIIPLRHPVYYGAPTQYHTPNEDTVVDYGDRRRNKLLLSRSAARLHCMWITIFSNLSIA